MMKISKTLRAISLGSAAAGILLICGSLVQVEAQRDPFAKPSYQKAKTPGPAGATPGKPGAKAGPAVPVSYGPPAIEARIDYYKRLRETAAASGAPLPKVTSVLTLNELSVTGIFKTPRGYAAMVEAVPIKLSYTIYPGEKFFDGQLVAVEENKLVFRKVTKTGEGKFVASVENKPLKQYTTKAQIEGTAPPQPSDKAAEATAKTTPAETAAKTAVTSPKTKDPKSPVNPFLSPLDEMNNQKPVESDKGKNTKPTTKKPVKVAKTDGH